MTMASEGETVEAGGPVTAPARPAPRAGLEAAPERPVHLTLNLDATTAFFNRGYLQEDTGLIVQPAAKLDVDLARWGENQLSLEARIWNSAHSQATGADEGDNFRRYWFEQDLSAGVVLTHGEWTISGSYLAQTSPADAFDTVQEFDAGVAFDDSKLLGAWALNPTATLAFEFGPHAGDGQDKGVYLELGVAPGFKVPCGGREVAVSFPVTAGLSLHDFYQNSRGDDEVLGFVQAGPKVAIPLGSAGGGEWTLTGAVYGVYLGSHTAEFNDHGRRGAVVATVGLRYAF
jgi:hypothetical protein